MLCWIDGTEGTVHKSVLKTEDDVNIYAVVGDVWFNCRWLLCAVELDMPRFVWVVITTSVEHCGSIFNYCL